MHIVEMKVIELTATDIRQLAMVEISRHDGPEEAERVIERINADTYQDGERIERLKLAVASFYGARRELMFVFTKRPV